MLLPDLAPRLHTLAPAMLAALAANPDGVAAALLSLRVALPGTAVSRMVAARPQLALTPPSAETLSDVVTSLVKTLETDAATIQRLLSDHPDLIDADGVAAAVEEGRRVLGAAFDVGAVVADPRYLYRVQAGALLIPYDQFSDGAGENTTGAG